LFTLRCEVCGRKIHSEPLRAIIEGAKLTVCTECSKHGKVIAHEELDLPTPKAASKTGASRPMSQKRPITARVEITQELVDGYSNLIRAAREKLLLNHEDLGQKINEKASVLKHIESKKMAPNNLLATKLEHALKIKLLVPITAEKTVAIPKTSNKELTLGDLIEIEQKDKKKEAPAKRKQS
jgi:putative transcription factor